MTTELRKEFIKARDLTAQSAAFGAVGITLGGMTAFNGILNAAAGQIVGAFACAVVGGVVGVGGYLTSRKYRKEADEIMEAALRNAETAMSQPVDQFRVPEGNIAGTLPRNTPE